MAWRCTGSTNLELIQNLASGKIINNQRVIQAMKETDRGWYLPNRKPGVISDNRAAYEDSPYPIGFGATISAPHMHGMCLEYLIDYLKEGNKVMDIGAGSGYLASCMARLVYNQKQITNDKDTQNNNNNNNNNNNVNSVNNNNNNKSSGLVVALEHIPQLLDFAKENINDDFNNQNKQNNINNNNNNQANKIIHFICGDGRLGCESLGPFDCIHVGAAADKVPQKLLDQLAVPGRLIIPVGPNGGDQYLYMIDKLADNQFKQQILTGVRYVPLTSSQFQLKNSN